MCKAHLALAEAASLIGPFGAKGLEKALEYQVELDWTQWVSLFDPPLYVELSAEFVCSYFRFLICVQ